MTTMSIPESTSCGQKDWTNYRQGQPPGPSSRQKSRVVINNTTNDQSESELADYLDDSDPLLSYNGASTSQRGSKFTTTEEYEAQIAREVRKYRLKYIFCQSCPKFCRNSRNRIPSEKSVYLALFLCFFERLAYYAAVGNILQPFLSTAYPNISPAVQSLLFSIFMDMLAQLLFPIFGWIADARVGRYNMLHFSMWFLWFSYGLITLLFSLDNRVSWNRYLLPVWMIIINIGSAGFQATSIPFAADQIVYGPSEQISSFFYWYYWLRNLGSFFLYLSFTCTNFDTQWHGIVFGLVATTSMSIALILNAALNGWFFIDPEKRDPLWKIIKIFLAVTKVKRPRIRSAFSFSNLQAPTRMDLTKMVHGGQFESEEVENAKTVGRIFMVLLSVTGALIAYRGMVNVIGIEVQGTHGGTFFTFSTGFLKQCQFETNFTWILNVVVVLITVPILNQCLVPFLREYRPNILQKIVIGYLLAIFSYISMLAIIEVGESMLRHNGHYENSTRECIFITDFDNDPEYVKLPVRSWTIMVPHILISVAEVFINISCLEFCYAQSPHHMRGLMLGFFFFLVGFSDTVATAILTFFSLKEVGPPESCNFWYHLVFLVIGVIMFLVFYPVARWYRNRKRPISNENYVYYNLMKGSKH